MLEEVGVGVGIGGYYYKPFLKWKQKSQYPNAKMNIYQLH